MIQKQFLVAATAIFMFISCSQSGNYGNSFDSKNAVEVNQAIAQFKEKGTADFVISGNISTVCQSEGCWFNYQTKDGELFVDFEHKFEIPKTVKGKTAFAQGAFQYDTTSIEQLKEYAKDDGKKQEEIDEIKEPEIRLIFIAKGVQIK